MDSESTQQRSPTPPGSMTQGEIQSTNANTSQTSPSGLGEEKAEGSNDATHASGLEHQLDQQSLNYAIRQSMVKSVIGPDSRFLPTDKFDEIVTRSNITAELRRHAHQGWNQSFVAISAQVLGNSLENSNANSAGRRWIFAVLALMQKTRKIVQFIENDIWDHHLPFSFKQHAEGNISCSDKYGNPVSIALFGKERNCDTFKLYQWQLNAPYFKLSFEDKQIVTSYDLNDLTVLPFIGEIKLSDDFSKSLAQEGGQSIVRRVTIHPAHYTSNANSASTRSPHFAVKQIGFDDEASRAHGRKEAMALKRFGNHGHLIQLLATYTFDGYFHMIFPWADGNLKDFWSRSYEDPSALRKEGKLARWMLEQCLGLADALRSIHKSEISETNVQEFPPQYPEKSYGRHGDLKPENILWFKDEAVNDFNTGLGVLKISDFGLADFHGPLSHSVGVSKVGYTNTYKAPEYDVKARVSPTYDMWSLGCVFLQFVTWYLSGWEGVDGFSKRRADDSNNLIAEDRFFNFYSYQDSSGHHVLTASLKKSVLKEFQSLKDHSACNDFMLDLLDIIQFFLLRMQPKHRANSEFVVSRLAGMCHDLTQNGEYLFRRTRRVSKAASEESELVHVTLSLSPEMEDLNRNILKFSGRNSIVTDPQHGTPAESSPENRTNEFPCPPAPSGPNERLEGGSESASIARSPNADSSTGRVPNSGPSRRILFVQGFNWFGRLLKRFFCIGKQS